MQRIYLIIFLMLFVVCTAEAASPPEMPFIRLNTALHSAKIMDIATDAHLSRLVTASFDKTAKMWDADSGKLLKTFRPPIGVGLEGTLFAVAISPDGSMVAAAGWTGFSWNKAFCVYLFDVNRGEIIKRLTGFNQAIQRLAFSPNGKRLAVGLNNSGGVRVINLDDNRRVLEDRSFEGNCFGLQFDQQGNLVASSDAGVIRLYRVDGSTVYTVKTENGKQILDTCFSPDGKQIAIVYDDYYGVEVRTAQDGALDFVLQQPKGRFFSVAWSADGRYLLAAGGNKAQDSRKLLIKWSVRTRTLNDLLVLPSKSGISRLLTLKEDKLAFVARLTGFGVLNHESTSGFGVASKGNGRRHQQGPKAAAEADLLFYHELSAADFQKNHDLFKVSPDGLSVLFSYERYGQSPARFDLKNRKLVVDNPSDSDLLPHRFTADGVDIQNWVDSDQPRLNKRKLKGFGSRDLSRSLAVRHDEKGFVLGSNHYLRHFSRNGDLLWKQRIPQVAWDVALSCDDKVLVAALDDGTIRWYRMIDGRELYALYLHPDKKRWLLWSPDGYFDHGAGSANLIGFQVNRGAEQSSVMVGAERMFDLLYRPDLLNKIIDGKELGPYLQRLQIRASGKAALAEPEGQAERTRQQALQRRLEQERLSKEKQAAEALKRRQTEAEAAYLAQRQAEQARRLKQEQASRQQTESTDEAEQEDAEAALPQPESKTALADLVTSATLPPKVRFITASGSTTQPDVRLQADLCDVGGGIGNVTLYLNNTPIAFDQSSRGLVAHPKGQTGDCIRFERVVTLAAGENRIGLMAFNRTNSIESERSLITLRYETAEPTKPRLHLLTVAIDRYQERALGLKYSVNDAEALIKLVTEKAQKLFAGIDTYRLYNEQVTRNGLEHTFARISAKAERGDVFVLFLAGHGLTDELDGMYYFLPADFRNSGQAAAVQQGISMQDFKQYVSSVKALKSLFLVDTCSSGAFSEGMAGQPATEQVALGKLARSVGRATLAASSRDQVALEGYQGHGVFSYTLLQGLGGAAANRKGLITITNLALFVEETLPELTMKKWGYEQIPHKALIGLDFQIGAN